MLKLTETVRQVVRKYPVTRTDNVLLVQATWCLQKQAGDDNLFDPASILRVRQRITGGKHCETKNA
jgi:hypothetical protein